jgi:hypothetical protein
MLYQLFSFTKLCCFNYGTRCKANNLMWAFGVHDCFNITHCNKDKTIHFWSLACENMDPMCWCLMYSGCAVSVLLIHHGPWKLISCKAGNIMWVLGACKVLHAASKKHALRPGMRFLHTKPVLQKIGHVMSIPAGRYSVRALLIPVCILIIMNTHKGLYQHTWLPLFWGSICPSMQHFSKSK